MAKEKTPAASDTISLGLKASKETKGTYVYDMIAPNGSPCGGLYLPKLLFVTKPGAKLKMVITPDDTPDEGGK